jgi:hypothetical protein
MKTKLVRLEKITRMSMFLGKSIPKSLGEKCQSLLNLAQAASS